MKPIYVVFIDIFYQSFYYIFCISFNLCRSVKFFLKSAFFFSKSKKKFGQRIRNPTIKKNVPPVFPKEKFSIFKTRHASRIDV